MGETVKPGDILDVTVTDKDGKAEVIQVKARFDSEVEVDYYRHGGILPLVLRKKLSE